MRVCAECEWCGDGWRGVSCVHMAGALTRRARLLASRWCNGDDWRCKRLNHGRGAGNVIDGRPCSTLDGEGVLLVSLLEGGH